MISHSFSKRLFPLKKQIKLTEIRKQYDQDYYWGVTSGYTREGYRSLKEVWAPWLELIEAVFPPPAILIDFGAAYGFLTESARKKGFKAFGIEISSYALSQKESKPGGIALADLHQPPFPGEVADIVTLFDVIEHLENPLLTLKEARRLLKDDGLLILTTPDPIFFDRDEPTHLFERPPSFWLAALEELDLVPSFRFSNDAYNFQLLATPAASQFREAIARFHHDYFGDQAEFVHHNQVTGTAQPQIELVPREGWGGVERRRKTTVRH